MKILSKTIKISITAEGVHRWEECNEPEVSYLICIHRHNFYITVEKEVQHNNRDIEFISLKHRIEEHLQKYHSKEYNCLDFKTMSCEDIAEELAEMYECSRVEVMEDNENGAVIYAQHER